MENQSYLFGHNRFAIDQDLPVLLEHYWPGWKAARGRLDDIGRIAGTDALSVTWHVDRDAPPQLVMYDLDGQRVDRARISPAHQRLLADIASVNAVPYRTDGSWHEYTADLFLLADAGLVCMLVITGQTAYAVHKYAPSLHDPWMGALTDGSAWGATWFTEVQGGTDLGANTVAAREVDGQWLLSGEKYFCSGAGLTDLALVTARPEGAPPGPKGLALYLVPRLSSTGEVNYSVRRLKDKSATRSVPSGEVSLQDSEAWLVGSAGEGIYYTLENLTLSRIANAAGAAGLARAAQHEAVARCKARSVFGHPLFDQPLIRRDLLEMQLRTIACAAMAFRATAAFEKSWLQEPPWGEEYSVTRVWCHLAKMRTAELAIESTQQAVELFGGIGYVEDFGIHRLHREAMVLPIWEGPANVQSLDLVEALQRKQAGAPFLGDLQSRLEGQPSKLAAELLDLATQAVNELATDRGAQAQWNAKQRTRRLADIAAACAILELSQTGGARYERLAELYTERYLRSGSLPATAADEPDLIDSYCTETATTGVSVGGRY